MGKRRGIGFEKSVPSFNKSLLRALYVPNTVLGAPDTGRHHRPGASLWACSACNLAPLESHWRRQWHPTPVLLPGKSHGRGSLEGCSPWGR